MLDGPEEKLQVDSEEAPVVLYSLSRLAATWRQGERNGYGVKAGAPFLGIHQPAVKPATRQACDPASSSNGDQTPRTERASSPTILGRCANYYQHHVTNVRRRWHERYDEAHSTYKR